MYDFFFPFDRKSLHFVTSHVHGPRKLITSFMQKLTTFCTENQDLFFLKIVAQKVDHIRVDIMVLEFAFEDT